MTRGHGTAGTTVVVTAVVTGSHSTASIMVMVPGVVGCASGIPAMMVTAMMSRVEVHRATSSNRGSALGRDKLQQSLRALGSALNGSGVRVAALEGQQR
ncbi:hypothetical protein H696_01788 [Fonticula alba]|uniref:Uncharacterized protein n=1 Tax=Fonticula alba TaxID=691883 RepID=A0A058ZEP5_FONAL|nr:hypothetical protein H696_01788 [Fonticula alba]KCV72393.1 hypothetical protein H696_01788 [Fonticula alba]|eukprot:XP_009493971.1 hypothetical protein H696_01788 [Fonticula alba]